MSGFRFSFPACVIAGKGRIVADDIVLLRRYAFPDGIRSSDDALTLMALNETCSEKCTAWPSYYVESLAAYLVRASTPVRAIDEARAGWLMRMIASDGIIHSPLQLELLLHVMEIASDVPENLSAFALDQIRLALEPEPRGAYHALRPQSQGISTFDLTYIWRILRGALERGRLMLSPLEAMVLREIDMLAPSAAHHPAWREMMAAIVTLDRPKEVLRASRWLIADDLHFLDEEVAA